MIARPLRPFVYALVGSFAAAATLLAALAQSSVAGNWALEVDSPQGITKANLALAVDGEALKGTLSSDMGETPFTGSAKDGAIKFTFDFAGPQGPMSITATGTVSGDDIKGEMDYGMGIATFTGKRAGK
jgi:hypothetical protein